jgi:hypothetical protein
VYYMDLLDVSGTAHGLDNALKAAPKHKLLVLDHFDHRLDDPAWSGTLLVALETELLHGRRVVLMTSREPCALFPLPEQLGQNRDPVRERWTRLLGQFVDVAVAEIASGADARFGEDVREMAEGVVDRGDTGDPDRDRARKAEVALQRECGVHRRLEEIAVQLRRRPDFSQLTPEGVVEQVRDLGDSYYHALWTILEQDEKVVVSQLAHGVVVNPTGKRAARRLLARRILRRDPELHLMNESFRRFIREEIPTSTIEKWERGEPSSPWQRLRFPIGLGLLAVVAFLFVTQRSAFDSAIALVTAAGVGTTAILKVLSAARLPGRTGQ